MRPGALLLLGVVLLPLAGCVSAPASDAPGQSPTSTLTSRSPPATTSAPPTSDDPYDCGYHLLVDVASDEQANRTERSIRFSSLSGAEQAVFLEALETGGADLGDELRYPWSSLAIVRYNGTQYFAAIATC